MKRLVIGVDIDGVIVDLVTAMLPLLSEVCCRPISHQNLYCWDIGQALGVDQETMNIFWERFFDSNALRYASPIDGAPNVLSKLSEHEIWLVTNRPVRTQDITLSWLSNNRIHYDEIVFNNGGDKISVGPKFNVFIEDSLNETISIAKTGILSILFDQPWNQISELPANCKRVYNWDSVLYLIDNLIAV